MIGKSCWAVTINFTEGDPHTGQIDAETRVHAFYLALHESRADAPFGAFHAPVVSWDAVLVETEEV